MKRYFVLALALAATFFACKGRVNSSQAMASGEKGTLEYYQILLDNCGESAQCVGKVLLAAIFDKKAGNGGGGSGPEITVDYYWDRDCAGTKAKSITGIPGDEFGRVTWCREQMSGLAEDARIKSIKSQGSCLNISPQTPGRVCNTFPQRINPGEQMKTFHLTADCSDDPPFAVGFVPPGVDPQSHCSGVLMGFSKDVASVKINGACVKIPAGYVAVKACTQVVKGAIK